MSYHSISAALRRINQAIGGNLETGQHETGRTAQEEADEKTDAETDREARGAKTPPYPAQVSRLGVKRAAPS